jgi:hypothetical protein
MLRVYENRVLRRIFGSKRVEVIGKWRRLQNKELNKMISSQYIIWIGKRRSTLAVHVENMRDRRGVYMVSVGIPEGQRSLGRLRHR